VRWCQVLDGKDPLRSRGKRIVPQIMGVVPAGSLALKM